MSITSKGPRYDISNEFVFLGSDTKNLSPGVNVPSLVILFAYSRCLCPDICKDSIPSLHATTILPLQSSTYRYTIHLLFWFRDIFLHNHNHKHNFPVGKVPPLINISFVDCYFRSLKHLHFPDLMTESFDLVPMNDFVCNCYLSQLCL